jgi:hypothetical protein
MDMLSFKKSKLTASLFGEVPIRNFFSSIHPEVYLIPQADYFKVVDDFGDAVGFFQLPMPFSSFNFYADFDLDGGVFSALYHEPTFHRMGGISQLGYLCSPKPASILEKTKVYYSVPHFPHTRWGHSLLTGILAELVLARNGFSKAERDPFVLAAACHDIAMPAGGDSVMRVDPERLSEENNFRYVMERDGLAVRWAEQFGFDITEAEKWVHNLGPFGKLLDVIDKIAYTAHDAHYVSNVLDSRVKRYCNQHQLMMDVWQDIRFDGENVWFASPPRLFDFLLLRAYLHCDIYLNPRSRALDYVLFNQVARHYRPEMREQLLLWNDEQLEIWLQGKGESGGLVSSPDDLVWEKFANQKEADSFIAHVKRLSHVDHVKPFKTGLDWIVGNGRQRTQLQFVIPKRKIDQLESLSKRHSGWYVYYFQD